MEKIREFPMNQDFVVMGQATRLPNGRHLRSPSFFPTGPPRTIFQKREKRKEREKRIEREERERRQSTMKFS